MSCSPSISRAAIAGSAIALALLGCAGSLDQPARFANLGSFPDAGTVTSSSDGGCDPVVDLFPLGCATSACHSAQSVMLLKSTDTPPFGFQMPLGAEPLSTGEMACLQAWVDAAATP